MEIATDPHFSWENNDLLVNLIDGITSDELLALDYSWKYVLKQVYSWFYKKKNIPTYL